MGTICTYFIHVFCMFDRIIHLSIASKLILNLFPLFVLKRFVDLTSQQHESLDVLSFLWLRQPF